MLDARQASVEDCCVHAAVRERRWALESVSSVEVRWLLGFDQLFAFRLDREVVVLT